MKKLVLLSTFFVLIFYSVTAEQYRPNIELNNNRSHSCFDAYQLGGSWVIIRCLGCSQVARVKNVSLPGQCGGGNGDVPKQ